MSCILKGLTGVPRLRHRQLSFILKFRANRLIPVHSTIFNQVSVTSMVCITERYRASAGGSLAVAKTRVQPSFCSRRMPSNSHRLAQAAPPVLGCGAHQHAHR